MKWRTLVALLFGAAPSLAAAASTVVVVTPETNIDLPLQFRVETETSEDGIVRFEISVSPGESEISPHRDARFVVWGEHPEAAPEKGFGARKIPDRPVSLSAASVKERERDGNPLYEVQVHQSVLPRVSLTFLNYEASGMPAFDGYEIILGRFVTAER